jgi:hypothetical protein
VAASSAETRPTVDARDAAGTTVTALAASARTAAQASAAVGIARASGGSKAVFVTKAWRFLRVWRVHAMGPGIGFEAATSAAASKGAAARGG